MPHVFFIANLCNQFRWQELYRWITCNVL